MVGAGAASVLLSLGAVSRVINPYLSSALQPPMLVLPPAPQVEDELKGDASQQEFVTKISKKEKEKLKAKNNAGLNSNSSTQNGNGNGNNKNNKNNNKNNTDSLAFATGAGGGGLAKTIQVVKKKFDAVYEDAPYHTSKGNSVKSAKPTDGQKTLENSIQVKSTSQRRVGVDRENGEFVVFDKTQTGKFHGHVRTWSELEQDMQNVLKKAGLVKNNGKIIK